METFYQGFPLLTFPLIMIKARLKNSLKAFVIPGLASTSFFSFCILERTPAFLKIPTASLAVFLKYRMAYNIH